MADVTVHSTDGGAGSTVSLRDDVFGRTPKAALLHQAVVRQQANARQGTHDTQTRAEVSRTTKKVWRQKGTGRARQGSRKGPHWTGGGVAFGPHPRSYRQDMPKKMRVAALCDALSSKAEAGQLVLLADITMDTPSTKILARTMASVAPGRSALLVLDTPNKTVQLSARNLPNVTAITTDSINVLDILRHEQLVLTTAAARVLEERYRKRDDSEASGATGPAASAKAPASAAEAPAEAEAESPAKAKRAPRASRRAEPAAEPAAEPTGEAETALATESAGAEAKE